MLRACCSPKYECLYHIIIAGFVARGMEFGQSETTNQTSKISPLESIQAVAEKSLGATAFSSLLQAVNNNSNVL